MSGKTWAQRAASLAVFTGRRSHLGYYTFGPTPYAARLTVRALLKARRLSAYQVAMSGLAQGSIDRGTAYRLVHGDVKRLDLHSLEVLAGIIHTLTGKPVSITDLLSLWKRNRLK